MLKLPTRLSRGVQRHPGLSAVDVALPLSLHGAGISMNEQMKFATLPKESVQMRSEDLIQRRHELLALFGTLQSSMAGASVAMQSPTQKISPHLLEVLRVKEVAQAVVILEPENGMATGTSFNQQAEEVERHFVHD